MPEIEVRPAIANDIPILTQLFHHYTSDHVWQIEFRHDRETDQVQVNFRSVRLPRAVRVEYPRSGHALADDWTRRHGLLVANLADEPIGYISMNLDHAPYTAWVTDLVVGKPYRRQGIASALLLAALEWAHHMDQRHLVIEMQPKNHPAIQLAKKLGFEFCGYNDRYYPNQEIGIFFGKGLH